MHSTWTFTPDEREILSLAVEAVDRAAWAQDEINTHGLLLSDRFGQLKENPACTIRNAAEMNSGRLLKQLGLAKDAERLLKNDRIATGVLEFHKRKRRA